MNQIYITWKYILIKMLMEYFHKTDPRVFKLVVRASKLKIPKHTIVIDSPLTNMFFQQGI